MIKVDIILVFLFIYKEYDGSRVFKNYDVFSFFLIIVMVGNIICFSLGFIFVIRVVDFFID